MAVAIITQTLTRVGRVLNSAMLLTINWTADSTDGSVTATPLTTDIKSQIAGWYITKVITNPSTPSPTNLHDITLVDSDGLDLADSDLLNRSATASEAAIISALVDANGFTFTLVGNSVNSAQGQCKIYLNK